MAKRPAQWQGALSPQIGKYRSAAFNLDAIARARAKRQISNDQESGERRSARLKCRTLQRYKNYSEITEMLDCSRGERNRQKRRIRQVGRRGEMDITADRAKVVCLIRGMLRRILLR